VLVPPPVPVPPEVPPEVPEVPPLVPPEVAPEVPDVPPVAAPEVPDEAAPDDDVPPEVPLDGVPEPEVAGLVVDGVAVDEAVVLLLVAADDEPVDDSTTLCGASRGGSVSGTMSCEAELPPQALRPVVSTRAVATAVTRRRMTIAVSPAWCPRRAPCGARRSGSR
jgi:hypothetical protein